VHFVTVFDAAQMGYTDWSLPAGTLIFVAFGAFKVFYSTSRPNLERKSLIARNPRVFYALVLCFSVILSVVVFWATFTHYQTLRDALDHGNTQVVEGRIKNFQPEISDLSEKRYESFDVGDRHFSYSTNIVTGAFNKSRASGGPMAEGLYVRIHYTGNSILRLEIRE